MNNHEWEHNFAQTEGAQARRAGHPTSANPYHHIRNRAGFNGWLEGWYAENTDMERHAKRQKRVERGER